MTAVAGDASAGSAQANPTAENSRPRGDGNRGRGRGRGSRGRGRGDGQPRGGSAPRGRGRGNSVPSATEPTIAANSAATVSPPSPKNALLRSPALRPKTEGAEQSGEEPEGEVCFICANPIIHYSIAPCNHVTCHICAIRMRALYKNKDCPHCRRFDGYVSADTTSTDDNIGIRYTSEDIVGDTILLLRYNCPDESCDFAGLGWPDLHRHVRSVHHKKMCDLCTRNKKVFTHEHDLFTDKALEKHMRHGDDQPGALDQTGFKGHPLCTFCGERFYDDDKLYEHCRSKHERCFICDRRDSRQPHYYQNYNALEQHFRKDHFLCLDRECQEKKFVVFESELDLKAHQLSEHGDTLSKDVRRDARVVDMSSFDFRPTYQQERRGGRNQGEGRGRGRHPDSEPLPMSSAQPLRRDELAFQRTMAIHSAQSVSNRTFGGQLSSSTSQTPARQPAASASTSSPAGEPTTQDARDLESLPPKERAEILRHGAVIERAANLLGRDPAKTDTFRAEISSYRKSQVTAAQLIDSFFALFTDTSSTALGTLVRELADLFEDRTKAEALRKAWQDWRAINEDYPSLPGLGGMHGATTSTSGWANAAASSPTTKPASAAAQKHTTRVLRLKSSTRRGSLQSQSSSLSSSSNPAPTPASTVPGATWTAPARPAAPPASSMAFPALPSASSSRNTQPSSSGWFTTPRAVTAAPPSNARRSAPPPPQQQQTPNRPRTTLGSEESFPALPAAPKPLTTIFGYGTGAVRRDLGGRRDTGFSWTGPRGGEQAAPEGVATEENVAGGAGGKGKKKKKQVLANWG